MRRSAMARLRRRVRRFLRGRPPQCGECGNTSAAFATMGDDPDYLCLMCDLEGPMRPVALRDVDPKRDYEGGLM